MLDDVPRAVTTENDGKSWKVVRRLGAGGQGMVLLLQGGRFVAKVLHARDAARREELRRRLAFVRRLELADLPVARPILPLAAPHVGYVMELLSGMVPASTLVASPAKGVSDWYLATGGLRRRLRLLAHAGEVIAALHGKGLVYGDLSPGNLFVSEEHGAHEAWLIDADNLAHATAPGPAVYTPGYGAPEVVSGSRPPGTLSDAWAFATLAFQALSLAHPFVGDAVDGGTPEDEERAHAGLLPFVDDPDDDSNRSSRGIPRELVLTSRLRDLARKTFSGGRKDALERPGVATWVEALHDAADRTIRCAQCTSTYFPARERRCPFCEAPQPPVYRLRTLLYDPRLPANARLLRDRQALFDLPVLHATPGDTLRLTRRVTDDAAGVAAREVQLEASFTDGRMELLMPAGRSVWIQHDDRKPPVATRGSRASAGFGWAIHLGPEDRLHRVLVASRVEAT